MKEVLLQVENLSVGFHTYRGDIHAVRNISYNLHKGEALGIVGESGCGKSVSVHAIMQLLPEENSFVKAGKAFLGEQELLGLKEKDMRKIRGNKISMIFQDPMTSLNPVLKIGNQMLEGIMVHKKVSKEEAGKQAVELLQAVGISSPETRLNSYPHQFSGGMRQRVMIAMALACKPGIIIADEPTTALDVTIQAQILELMDNLKETFQTSIILISHDLGVIATLCDRVLVMYAGELLEGGSAEDVFYRAAHPYTQGLLASLPGTAANGKNKLHVIEGQPPNLLKEIKGCAFLPRCKYAMEICSREMPPKNTVDCEHWVKCWLNYKNGGGNLG